MRGVNRSNRGGETVVDRGGETGGGEEI